MKLIKYFIILLVCISCDSNENKSDKNKYHILNLIYRDYSKYQMEFFVFQAKQPPPPSNSSYKGKNSKLNLLNKKDSLIKIKNYIRNKENQQIFAFDSKMKRYHNMKGRKLKENMIAFESLYKDFVASKKIDFLDINKITPQNNDKLTVFKSELLKNKVNVEFESFDVFVSFSDIIFNNNYSKAIVIGTRSFSRTDTHSFIYFLEKQNGKWEKVFEQTL